MANLFASAFSLIGASEVAIWSSLSGYALQMINKFQSPGAAAKLGESFLDEDNGRADERFELRQFLRCRAVFKFLFDRTLCLRVKRS